MLAILLFAIVGTQQADLILFNGKIFTSDTARLYVHALAIKGNTILATGEDRQVMGYAGKTTRLIDLQGRTVVPGFNDAHDHLGWLAPGPRTYLTEFSIPGPSKAAVRDSLAKYRRNARPGQWLSGTIGLAVFLDSTARREWLDSLAPDNPVALQLSWGHGTLINSKALSMLAIADTAPDPLSGWYERAPATKPSGKAVPTTRRLTGACFEGAQFPIWDALSAADPENIIKTLDAHAKEQLQLGITSVQNMSSTMQGNTAKQIFSKAQLPVRTRLIEMPASTEKGRHPSHWEGFSGIKYIIDGTPLERTALMTQPYPGGTGNNGQYGRHDQFGRLDYPVDTIRQILTEALQSKRQLMLHVVGDSATIIVIRLMKELAPPAAWRNKRVRIEHGDGIRPSQLKDIHYMGIIVINTPQYGADNPLQTWIRAGIPVAVGPDALINPFLAIHTMCAAQKDAKENLTVEQAVIAYTRTAAYAEFAEGSKGTLTPGKLADLAILSQDIFTIPLNQLEQTRSLLTVVDGKIVHNNWP